MCMFFVEAFSEVQLACINCVCLFSYNCILKCLCVLMSFVFLCVIIVEDLTQVMSVGYNYCNSGVNSSFVFLILFAKVLGFNGFRFGGI